MKSDNKNLTLKEKYLVAKIWLLGFLAGYLSTILIQITDKPIMQFIMCILIILCARFFAYDIYLKYKNKGGD